jgi:CMP-N,N'-diacetyllegionaminic acid synthase
VKFLNYLIFIPARSGSKGVKNKNLKLLKKKPLIFYTLKIAKQISKKIKSDIFISTDSKKILKYCKNEIKIGNYLRPKNLSNDSSTILDTISHSLEYLKKMKKNYDSIIVLQPTSPARKFKELYSAIKVYERKKLVSLVSVCPTREHPNEIIRLRKNNFKYLLKPNNFKQRQQYKKYFFIDGDFYITNLNFLKKSKTLLSEKKTWPFITKKTWPIDIDYLEDFKVAENFI